jgi:AraC-like DNA-binding protein
MDIILLFGVFETLFLILLLVGKRRKVKADWYLGILLGLYGLTIAGAYLELYNFKHNFSLPAFLNLSWLLLFLHGPALWFYIQALTRPSFRLKALHLLHLLPFIIFFAFQYVIFFSLPAEEKIIIVGSELFRNWPFYKISVACIGISNFTYNIWALLLIRKHKRRIKQTYSEIESIDLKWLKILIFAALTLYAVNVALFNLNTVLSFTSYRELTFITYIFATLYVLFLGYFGLQQGRIFISPVKGDLHRKNTSIAKTPVNIRQSGPYDEFIKKLTDTMEHRQPHLEPELTLSKMSSLLSVKPEFLSEVLNSALGQNFFDYINKHRIEEFKIQCLRKDKKHLSVLGLAYECGFNSKAAFYRAFKKFENRSPSAYIQEVSQ